MKIIEHKTDIEFKDVALGIVFKYYGCYYIKTMNFYDEEKEEKYNALNLNTNDFAFVCSNDFIEPKYNTELIIK